MDITEARKKLGNASKNMTNKEIEDLIIQMDVLANLMIDFMEDQIKQKRLPGESVNDCLKRITKELELRKTPLKVPS